MSNLSWIIKSNIEQEVSNKIELIKNIKNSSKKENKNKYFTVKYNKI